MLIKVNIILFSCLKIARKGDNSPCAGKTEPLELIC